MFCPCNNRYLDSVFLSRTRMDGVPLAIYAAFPFPFQPFYCITFFSFNNCRLFCFVFFSRFLVFLFFLFLFSPFFAENLACFDCVLVPGTLADRSLTSLDLSYTLTCGCFGLCLSHTVCDYCHHIAISCTNVFVNIINIWTLIV